MPETQRRSLTVSPGSEPLLFDEEILGGVVSQVQQSSLISSNLAMSRSFARGRGRSSSSPLAAPASAGASHPGQQRRKLSSSSSRFNSVSALGRGSAPSSGPSGFRKWEPSPCLTLFGGCLSLHWQAWRDRGAEPWVVEVLRFGYRIPFLSAPPLTKAPISMPSYHPLSTKRVALGEATRGPCGQECGGACSASFPRLLQLSFHCVEDLGVLETRHRSLDPQSLRGCVALPHGDHPVCPSLCSSGRLDGLHRPCGSLPAGPCPSGLSTLPSVCGSGQCVSVLCPLFRPLHGSTGLLMGHGSCFRHSSFLGYPHEAVPRRLAGPVVFSRVSPSRPQGGPRSLPRTEDCSESGEVPPRSFPSSSVSRGSGGLAVFPGFSIAGTRRQAAVNSQQISLLRRSSCEYLALAARHSVLSLLSRSWWPPPGEVSPAVSPPGLGSGRPVSQDSLDSSLPPGSSVVARPAPSVSRGVSGSGVSGSGLLVRRLGRGLGRSSRLSHRFRPLGCRARCSVHQRSGASGHQGGSPPLQLFSGREECGGVLRQLHSRVVSPQGGGHKVAVPRLPGSGYSQLGRVPLHQAATSVHSGVPERSGGLSLSPSPTSSYRVVSSSEGLSVYRSHVAGPNRLICHLSKSPMLHLFLSVQGSVGSGHRRLPPTLRRASGLLVSSVVCHPSSSGEAQVVSGDGAHPDSSLLASANLVCRSPSPVAGPSGGSAST